MPYYTITITLAQGMHNINSIYLEKMEERGELVALYTQKGDKTLILHTADVDPDTASALVEGLRLSPLVMRVGIEGKV